MITANVVRFVHQHVDVQAHMRCLHDFAQERQVAKAIAVVEKAGQAIVAALHEAWGTCHDPSLAGRDAGVNRWFVRDALGFKADEGQEK